MGAEEEKNGTTAPKIPTPDAHLLASVAVNKAAEDENNKRLEEARLRAERAEAALKARDVQDQQKDTQLQTLQKTVEGMNQMLHQTREATYRAQLSTFREQVIAAYKGEIIPAMVGGNTPDEIKASAAASNQEFIRVRSLGQQMVTQGQPPVPSYPNGIPQVPNPAFPAPPQWAGGSWPQAPNAAPPVPGGPGMPGYNMGEMTSEDAVRRGVYGQNRAQILHSVKNGGQSAPFPQLPQVPNGGPVQIPVQQLPFGVQQPQGTPIGPTWNPNYSGPPPQFQGGQPPQYQQPLQAPQYPAPPQYPGNPQGVDPAALASIQAMRNGQSPVLADPKAQASFKDRQAWAASQGVNVTPEQTFQQRFAPTPPDQG